MIKHIILGNKIKKSICKNSRLNVQKNSMYLSFFIKVCYKCQCSNHKIWNTFVQLFGSTRSTCNSQFHECQIGTTVHSLWKFNCKHKSSPSTVLLLQRHIFIIFYYLSFFHARDLRFNVLPSSNRSLHSAKTEGMAASHHNNWADTQQGNKTKTKQITDIQYKTMIPYGRHSYFMSP
jgi:hypothetical protein